MWRIMEIVVYDAVRGVLQSTDPVGQISTLGRSLHLAEAT